MKINSWIEMLMLLLAVLCYLSCSLIHPGPCKELGSRREGTVLLMRLGASYSYILYYPKFCCFWCRYLVTTFKVVPKGTEGAVSAEGTFAGFLASIFLAWTGVLIGEVSYSPYILHYNMLYVDWLVTWIHTLRIFALSLPTVSLTLSEP